MVDGIIVARGACQIVVSSVCGRGFVGRCHKWVAFDSLFLEEAVQFSCETALIYSAGGAPLPLPHCDLITFQSFPFLEGPTFPHCHPGDQAFSTGTLGFNHFQALDGTLVFWPRERYILRFG